MKTTILALLTVLSLSSYASCPDLSGEFYQCKSSLDHTNHNESMMTYLDTIKVEYIFDDYDNTGHGYILDKTYNVSDYDDFAPYDTILIGETRTLPINDEEASGTMSSSSSCNDNKFTQIMQVDVIIPDMPGMPDMSLKMQETNTYELDGGDLKITVILEDDETSEVITDTITCKRK
jgi:hypothetical protein